MTKRIRERTNKTIIKILSHPGSIPSAIVLKSMMQNLLNENKIQDVYVLVTKNPEKINSNLFIRYGCSLPTKYKTELNSEEFIRIASNKNLFSEICSKAGLHVPIFHTEEKPGKYPVLIRTSLQLSGGRGINVVLNEEEFNKYWRNGYYWTPFIKTNFEVRAHILGGNIVKIFRKESQSEVEKDFPIRNLDNGYHFSLRDLDKYPNIKEPLQKLAEIFLPLGGNFFTADMGWVREEKKYFFFEINSGSGLNENTSKVYAKFLIDKLLHKELKFKEDEEPKQLELITTETEIM